MTVERQKRIADMDQRWRKLQDLVRQRAKSPEMASVPGGRTGLLRRGKVVRSRHSDEFRAGYVLDTALLRELRRLERQVAKVLGQWSPLKSQQITFPRSTALPSGRPTPGSPAHRRRHEVGPGDRDCMRD
jgi:hypothetical protein